MTVVRKFALGIGEKTAGKLMSFNGQILAIPLLFDSTFLMKFLWTTTTVIILALAGAGIARRSTMERSVFGF
jgi:hypothetical protein